MTLHVLALNRFSTDADRIYASATDFPRGTPSSQQVTQLASMVNRWIRNWGALCEQLRNLQAGSHVQPLIISGLSLTGAIGKAKAAISSINPLIVHHNFRTHLAPSPPLARTDTDMHIEGLTTMIRMFDEFMDKVDGE